VTDSLLNKFNELYHCPTAFELPALQLPHTAISVIGLPTAPGAIINDGVVDNYESESSTATAAERLPAAACAQLIWRRVLARGQPIALCSLLRR
jgi:hypothetical protein